MASEVFSIGEYRDRVVGLTASRRFVKKRDGRYQQDSHMARDAAVSGQNRGGKTMAAESNLRLWEEHIRAEFVGKSVDDALATMVEDASVLMIPTGWGGKGTVALRPLYRDEFIPSIPDDYESRVLNRIVTEDRIVEEVIGRFHHTKRMDWFLPRLEPTGKPIEVQCITVIEFRDGRMTAERLYWDGATALRQIGRLEG
jgi:carboxymethylenebutenolidase